MPVSEKFSSFPSISLKYYTHITVRKKPLSFLHSSSDCIKFSHSVRNNFEIIIKRKKKKYKYVFNMKSSLFQFYFLDIRSIGAAEGIDGEKKKLEKCYCMWDYCSLQMSCTVYIAKRKKIPRLPKSKKQERSFLCKYHDSAWKSDADKKCADVKCEVIAKWAN